MNQVGFFTRGINALITKKHYSPRHRGGSLSMSLLRRLIANSLRYNADLYQLMRGEKP